MSRPPLTPAESRLYEVLKDAAAADESLTYREMLERLGRRSTGALHLTILALVTKGYARRRPGCNRSVELLPEPGVYSVSLRQELSDRLRAHAAAIGESPEDVILRGIVHQVGAAS